MREGLKIQYFSKRLAKSFWTYAVQIYKKLIFSATDLYYSKFAFLGLSLKIGFRGQSRHEL